MGEDAPLTRAKAAARLNVDPDDLDRDPWTKARVRALRAERPEWLTRARRAKEDGRREGAALAYGDLAAILEDLGVEPDAGLSHDEAVQRLDHAEMVARPRWPHEPAAFDDALAVLASTWWPAYYDQGGPGAC